MFLDLAYYNQYIPMQTENPAANRLWRKIGHQGKEVRFQNEEVRSFAKTQLPFTEDGEKSWCSEKNEALDFSFKQSLIEPKAKVIEVFQSVQKERQNQLFESILQFFPQRKRSVTFGKAEQISFDVEQTAKFASATQKKIKCLRSNLKDLHECYVMSKKYFEEELKKMKEFYDKNKQEWEKAYSQLARTRGQLTFSIKKLTLQNSVLQKINQEKDKRIHEFQCKIAVMEQKTKKLQQESMLCEQNIRVSPVHFRKSRKEKEEDTESDIQYQSTRTLSRQNSHSNILQPKDFKMPRKSISNCMEESKQNQFLKVPNFMDHCTSLSQDLLDKKSKSSSEELQGTNPPPRNRKILSQSQIQDETQFFNTTSIKVIPTKLSPTKELKHSPSSHILERRNSNQSNNNKASFKQKMKEMDYELRQNIKKVKEQIGMSMNKGVAL